MLLLTFTLLQAAFVLGVGACVTMLLFLAKHPAPADWPCDLFARQADQRSPDSAAR